MIATNTVHILDTISVRTEQSSKGPDFPLLVTRGIIIAGLVIGIWSTIALLGGMVAAGGPLGLADGFIHALSGI